VRDLVTASFFLGYVFFALRSPFAGYLLWGWSGLVALNFYVFGFMQGVPYVQVFALATLLMLVLQANKSERLEFRPNATSILMVAFVIHALFCALLAYPGLERNWELWGNIAKTVLFCLLMPVLANNRFRIHALVVMIVIGTSFHGVLDGLKFIRSAGAHNAQVISKFGDNNHLAMVLLMVVPLLYYLQIYSRRLWVRTAFLGALFLVVLGVMSTNSRGGLIGLLAVAVWLVYKSRHRLWGFTLVVLCAGLLVMKAPEDWLARMDTIKTAEDDASFMGRVMAWRVSAAIAHEHPVFGGGLRAVQSFPVWQKFKDAPGPLDFVEMTRQFSYAPAAHSIWFEVLGDQGYPGLLLFGLLMLNTFRVAAAVRKLVKNNGPSEQWAADLANMLTVAMVAFAITGSALSVAYFELPYVLMMLLEAVRQQQATIAEVAPKRGQK
jgi:probable O-glycosylation ligase (exosortase A-associated)